ncbi:sensor domain-containing protein [Mycobacterium sp. IDR2000157661]|uniref:sensor domain-containing protein n=1 Tax=Mycobacterium sp. IDR2000157661 TaxID=2867005 RepID=UPI001EEA019E|nr:sensor domain-containing protein [Mycobacterium sp. IDR2000157661]ULE31927.1 sensor domain-containing protein [Mycobacterium sp. IDR2000157661]
MRSAAVAMAAGACVLLAGCSTPAGEAPAVRIVEAVQQSPDRALGQALPSVEELTVVLSAVGFMGQLVEGGPDMLLQGVGPAEASPMDCVGIGYRLQKVVYQSSPVRSVASRSWAGGDADGPSATGFFGAVQFGAPDAARAFFAASADTWRRCNGQTLTLIGPDGGAQGSSRIADVTMADGIVSAVVLHDDGSAVQRALGIASDCVVDVEVSDVAGPSAHSAADAVAVAKLMVQKIGAS